MIYKYFLPFSKFAFSFCCWFPLLCRSFLVWCSPTCLFLLLLLLIIWFLSFILLILVCHINWLVDDEPSLYPWNKSHLIMVCIFIYCCILMYCWIHSDISLRIFASCSSEILACNFFPCGVLVCFSYQNTSFTRWVWQSSLLFCFWHFRRTVTYSLNVW